MTFSEHLELTKHRAGSLKELFALSFPIMFSCLSIYLLWFIDRCFLTYYSLDALNAVVNASALSWGFIGGTAVMAGMTELFVAQFNGAGHKKNIGESIWQMIWFSLATSFVFIPLGIWGVKFFYEMGSPEESYFRWTLLFGALQPLSYALTTFFVGRGRIKWIVFLAIGLVLLHSLFDYIFIFGIKGLIPPLGVTGAAITSCITLSCQAIVLMAFFLRKHNRLICGTGNWKFNFKSFWKSCRVTAPPAVLYNIEQIGWSVFYSMMTTAGLTHITISSLCQSLILLFSFFGDGVARGASVLSNNYLAAGRENLVRLVLRSSSALLCLFFLIKALLLAFLPNLFLKGILPKADEMNLFDKPLETCLWFVLAFLLFQGFQWLLCSLLYARGHTFFVMFAGSCSIWVCLILPVYFLVLKKGFSIEWAWASVVFYGFTSTLLYMWRLRRKESSRSALSTAL